jgi:hypothetical protein
MDKNDSDYNGMLYDAVMDLMRVFSSQGHSGFSAAMTLKLFNKVAHFETLTANDHSLFEDISEMMGRPCLQDKRDSKWFSDDGGKTWYDVEAKHKEKQANVGDY